MVNGQEYSWEDMEIVVEGESKPLEGIVEINYEKSKDHTNIYGRGADPKFAGRGKNEYTANMVLLQSEFDKWNKSLGKGKDVTDLTGFGITISYAPEGGAATTDQLTFVRVRKWKKGMKTGDGNMTIDLELIPGKIELDI